MYHAVPSPMSCYADEFLLFRTRGLFFFFFQAEDGIRDLVRSRGLGDVYKRQVFEISMADLFEPSAVDRRKRAKFIPIRPESSGNRCLLYTSDAADERSSVDLGGRRIIKKKNMSNTTLERVR